MLDLSVVIPTHNRAEALRELLESVNQQDLSKEQFEVIVVSNLDEPYYKTIQFKDLLNQIRGVHRVVGALNVNRARNLGIQTSKGSIIQLLDDDCFLRDPSFLSQIISTHDTYPEATAIGGGYDPAKDADPIDKAYNCLSRQWQELEFFGDYNSTRLVGGNVSYKKKLLLKAGEKFDETIKFGATEAEFHQRLQKKSYQTLFLSSIRVEHKTELTPRKLVEKAYRQAKGHEKFNIEQGFSTRSYKTFQSARDLLALNSARSESEYLSIIKFMNLYDWAYNSTLANPKWDERKVYWKSKIWLRKNRDSIVEHRC